LKAVYLTKEVLDIFDEMGYSQFFRKIIDGLHTSMSRSDVPSSQRIVLGKESLTVGVLKEVLGDLVNEDDLEAFAFIFNEKANKQKSKINKDSKEMGFYKNQQIDQQQGPTLIKFTDDFWEMLDKIRPGNDIIWDLYSLDSNPEIKNAMGITEVDISDKEWYFDIKTGSKPGQIKVAQFIKYFFKEKFTQDQIYKFIQAYNKIIGKIGGKSEHVGDVITPREFKYEPTNVRDTFISLVTETYPMGHEEEVVPFITPGLTRDQYGNYYTIIGDSDTAFTCHLDTASRTKDNVVLVGYKKDGQDFIMTDGTSILGADDKSGVAVIMYMIANNVPGVYWFFYGEERGGIGSGKVAMDYESYPFMKKVKKMISFDRRNYYSVITSQMGLECCSNDFAQSLCGELNKSGLKLNLDPTGVFTDSANFIDVIPECTNVSVGYFNEHTHDELQNITYLERLAKACVAADWSKLTVKRKIGIDDSLRGKYGKLIADFKKMIFYNVDSIKGADGKVVIDLEINDLDINHLYRDLAQMQELFSSHRLDPDIKFYDEHIKIELE
jgi:hypothetical protein